MTLNKILLATMVAIPLFFGTTASTYSMEKKDAFEEKKDRAGDCNEFVNDLFKFFGLSKPDNYDQLVATSDGRLKMVKMFAKKVEALCKDMNSHSSPTPHQGPVYAPQQPSGDQTKYNGHNQM